MLPPWPPSPPEGPPRGTYFSRRKAMQPLPPSPPFTNILASSTNTGRRLHKIDRAGNEKTVQRSRTAEAKKGGLKSAQNATTKSSGKMQLVRSGHGLLGGLDADKASVTA